MKAKGFDLSKAFLGQVRHSIHEYHLSRIERCLKTLSEEDIWWRPNEASNSVGNLVLHLSGNVRQWIISGLGGAPDRRERDQEFAECGPIPRRALLALLRRTVREASRVFERLTADDLARARPIQKFEVTGLTAAFHVAEHFAFHTGQIIYVAKMKRKLDLGFTRLPGEKNRRASGLKQI
ncbi:MAG: DUF1572 family protein [Terriglobia bacterium]